MKFYLCLPLLLFSPLLADSHPAYPPNPYDVQGGKLSPAFSEANAVAMHFITLLDAQSYDGAWLDAAGLMQDIITQDQWIAAMKGIRLPLGSASTRSVASHVTAHNLPRGTRGNFMIIKYHTQFRNAPQAEEIVTLMTIDETSYRGRVPGQWRVTAYKIKTRRS